MSFRFDFAPTPFGDALAVFSDEGIVRLDLTHAEDPDVPWLLEDTSRQLREIPRPDPGAADDLAHLLDAYFRGVPVRFHERVRLDWQLAHGFRLQALQQVCRIGWGQTMTYGEVAARAGKPGAARAVGSACRFSPFSIIVPVHRVVRADGSIGGYGESEHRKAFLLDLESFAEPTPASPGEAAG